ncbi:MAG: hypothetical protein KFB96_08520 [Thiocapsa sp.]|uniref:hypothetical protein n=1 Tax=Thiocapsa sp. TaxID=2024551 RepID=UPI001BD1B55D|nr:hypothetical protein [Thiocapsa sp.]QVL50452.1 MAG: hypothetical protein KFB96_08520 [Thiocapsa sp.]
MMRSGVLLCTLFLYGCVATVFPPPKTDHSRPVYILDHGRHTSLVLGTADQGLVRWAYGDWGWYAEGDQRPLRAFPVLLLRTPAALGRQSLHTAHDPEAIRAAVPVVTDRVFVIHADAARIDRLQARQEALFASGLQQGWLENPAFGFVFVPHPAPYRIDNNSNHMVANWLTQLGCVVQGHPMLGSWRIAESQ